MVVVTRSTHTLIDTCACRGNLLVVVFSAGDPTMMLPTTGCSGDDPSNPSGSSSGGVPAGTT